MRSMILILAVASPVFTGCMSMEPVEFTMGHPAYAGAEQTPVARETSKLGSYSLPNPARPNPGGDRAAVPAHTMDHGAMGSMPEMEKDPKQPTEAAGGERPHGSSPSNLAGLYTCPMHPEVVQDHEGRCPICDMRLLPKVDKPKEETPGDKP